MIKKNQRTYEGAFWTHTWVQEEPLTLPGFNI